MRKGKDLGKRHKTRAAVKLVDFDRLSRGITRLDPAWRSRKRLAGPIHREAAVVLRHDTELQGEGEQPGAG